MYSPGPRAYDGGLVVRMRCLQGLKTLISRSRLELLDLRGCSLQRSIEQELARMSTAYLQILV
jgi:hypothetical protein